MSIPTATSKPAHDTRQRGRRRTFLVWMAGFLAFPLAGILGGAAVGRVDNPVAALVGGSVTGAVVGFGQVLASSGRLPRLRWVGATALGMSAGLALGAAVVGYRTGLTDLVVMGAVTGAALGAAQAFVLPSAPRRRWVWAAAMPALWAIGWTVTTAAGVNVDEQFTIFGSTGAITVTTLTGVLLAALLRTTGPTPAPTTSRGTS